MKEAKGGSKKKAATKSAPRTTPEATKTASSESEGSVEPVVAAPAPQPPAVDREPQLPATHGKSGVFGGPKDRGIKPDDKLALPTGPHGVYERIRSLNPKGFYCAMRWNYHVEHMAPEDVKRWW